MKKLLIAAVAVAGLSSAAQSATVLNGGFENGTDPGAFTTVGPGEGAIDNWSVGGIGGVDYIGSYWQPHSGNRSIDLSGNGPGSVSQTIDTIFGQQYTVSFWLAGNPDGGDNAKLTITSVAGTVPGFDTFFVTPGVNTRENMGWAQYSYSFTAFDTQSVLTFASGEPNAFGPALDDVSILAVPEPSTWAFMIVGFGAVGYSLRRRKSYRLVQAV